MRSWIVGLALLLVLPRAAEAGLLDTILKVAGREVYIAFPLAGGGITRLDLAGERRVNGRTKGYMSANSRKVLFAFHGSGREARSYMPGDPKSNAFYEYQRNIALECGYVFVVASFGNDIWGKARAANDFISIYRHVLKTYDVEKEWTAWNTSAGGVLFANVHRMSPGIFRRAIGTFPVYNLKDSFERLESARKAWQDLSFAEYDPSNFPSSVIGIPYLIFHGRSDEAVPVELHSLKLKRDLGHAQTSIRLIKVRGGHSTSNWKMYQKRKIVRFLNYN